MALVKYSSEIIQYVIAKNAAELADAPARSAVVQAKSKTSGLRDERGELGGIARAFVRHLLIPLQ